MKTNQSELCASPVFPKQTGGDYWQTYYDAETLARAEALRETNSIVSGGAAIHIDVYPQSDPDAPVVIFNHGGAGYCRMFVALALSYFDRGYTVVLPDQVGQGFSGGRRGDCTIEEATQSIVDAAFWTKSRFDGPLYMGGGSMGGALTYYAAAAGAPVEAILCLNLVDFSTIDSWAFSKLAPLANVPCMAIMSRLLMWLLTPLHRVRIRSSWVGRFDKLMDRRDPVFQSLWDSDPVPCRSMSLRHLASASTTRAAVPLEENTIPTLVVNQSLDEMVDPLLTQRNFERLGGPKRYLEVPFGHWSSDPAFWNTIVDASDEWFRENMG